MNMKKTFIQHLVRATMFVCTTFLWLPTAWAQLDSIPIIGTAIDTTKVYDGTTSAHIATLGSWPLLPYSQVTIDAEAHYLDASVGNNKPVIVTFSLSGPDAFHYATPPSLILHADITPRGLMADSVVLQSSREYDGTTTCNVLSSGTLHGVLPNDTIGHSVTAHYSTPSVGFFKIVTVTHHLTGPHAANYTVLDSTFYRANIQRRTVSPSSVYIYTTKEYDGTDTANIPAQPQLNNAVEGDDISLHLTANFDTPEVGDNKTIYLHYQLLGADSINYRLTADSIYTTLGRIIPTLILDALGGDQPIVATAYGYCQRDSITFRYHVLQGELQTYSILFSEEAHAAGFTDALMLPCNDSEEIITYPFLPVTPGHYNATIELVSAGHVARQYPVAFNINLPSDYLVLAFNDVISIDNSGRLDNQPSRFHSYQWYRDGEAIPNATKPYYQEHGGLNGKYSVMVNLGTDDEAMVCPLILQPIAKPTVSLMPSPVVTTTTVTLQGFAGTQHQLQVFNSHGTMVFSTSFQGERHLLDLTTLPQGTYLITVDGHAAKTLKL